MSTPNEFWLTLHKLAEAYRDEGLTPEERLANVEEGFRALPLVARRQLLIDLAFCARHLPDVYEGMALLLRSEGQNNGDQSVG